MDIWSWFLSQSDAMKTAISAAVVGVIAVVVNNLVSVLGLVANNRIALLKLRQELEHDRLKTDIQLKHDREQRLEDRRLNLRRETYFGLAEHILAGLHAITAWADPVLEHKELVAARRRSAHFSAQIHLTAEPALVTASAECATAIDRAIVGVRIRRDVYLADRNRMMDLRRRIDEHRSRASAARDALRTRSLELSLPQGEMDRFLQIAKAENDLANPLAIEHDALLDKLHLERWRLFDYARKRETAVYPHVMKVIEAARQELGESIDMSVYSEVLVRMRENMDDSATRELFGIPAIATNAPERNSTV